MMTAETAFFKTPIGTAKIVGDAQGIHSVSVLDEDYETSTKIPECLKSCVTQLDEYFKGERTEFELTLTPQGTPFQLNVWKSLLRIPYGKTTNYLEQSIQLGDKKTIRAVASANGKNPIWIIIPCHRVLGSNGSLTGYAGGLWRKQWLLNHENPVKQTSLF